MSDEIEKPSNALAVRIDTVRKWLDAQTMELEKALPKGFEATQFKRIVLSAVHRDPKLAECDKASLILAVMEAGALGLPPDSQSGLAYLVPFQGRCQLIVGYRGLIQLMHRHPKVLDVGAEVVYSGDLFEEVLGSHPRLTHVPNRDGVRGELIGAYARASLRGGGHPFIFMPMEEIEEHRKRSPSKDSPRSPWNTDFVAMVRRTPIKTLGKFVPQSTELLRAMATEDDPELARPAASLYVPPGTAVDAVLDAIAGPEEEAR